MPEPKHYVVMEGVTNNKSDYTIQATGPVDKAGGRLGGVPVSIGSGDDVSGSTVQGTVWEGADGYRVFGGIKDIDIENPDHVQVHMGTIAGEPTDPRDDMCEVTIRADKVEFLEGQGIGEGALELEMEHNIHGAQSEHTFTKLPTGSTERLDVSIDNIKVPRSGSETKRLTTSITEREVPADWWTGRPDDGSDSMNIELTCGQPRTVSQTVRIDSDRDNPGKVKVYYTVGDLDD
jgi:hypothetical protein